MTRRDAVRGGGEGGGWAHLSFASDGNVARDCRRLHRRRLCALLNEGHTHMLTRDAEGPGTVKRAMSASTHAPVCSSNASSAAAHASAMRCSSTQALL